MFRNISAWSIRNPVPTILLFVVLTVAGIAGFLQMRINNFPDIDFPVVVVTATQPGDVSVAPATGPPSMACTLPTSTVPWQPSRSRNNVDQSRTSTWSILALGTTSVVGLPASVRPRSSR